MNHVAEAESCRPSAVSALGQGKRTKNVVPALHGTIAVAAQLSGKVKSVPFNRWLEIDSLTLTAVEDIMEVMMVSGQPQWWRQTNGGDHAGHPRASDDAKESSSASIDAAGVVRRT